MTDFVLVLNANFEPINTCDLRRAIGMVITEKATMILNGRGEIHTPTRSIPLPSVIRLEQMVHRPRIMIKLSRREVFRRDDYTCQYCGNTVLPLTIDHIIPKHLGGTHTWTNVVTACSVCNHKKGGRLLSEAHMALMHPVLQPSYSASYIFGRFLKENREWEPFLDGW